jgi:hypothetical protein
LVLENPGTLWLISHVLRLFLESHMQNMFSFQQRVWKYLIQEKKILRENNKALPENISNDQVGFTNL